MYVVKDSKGNVVAICTRKEDALAYKLSEGIDRTQYTVEQK